MSFLPYAVAAWLAIVGLYGVVTSRNLIHLVICLSVVQASTYVLLLGSSRFWQLDADTAAVALRETVGGDGPGLLKGAMPAGDPIVADYLLERLLAEGSHPRLIALEISPEIIANPSRWVAEHAVRFFTWRDVAVWTPEIVRAGKTRQVAAARFAPIHLYRRELLTWITGVQPPYLRVAAAVQAAAAGPADHDGAGPNAVTLFGLRETRKWLRRFSLPGLSRSTPAHPFPRAAR